ncbi:hypothetical protein I4U23_018124 [Adineta vaga]|nr:hypothetical protein I4U23_018124 [Adineta vaga]
MFTTTNNPTVQNLDELNRQKQQEEMIRQYLQVTNIDSINSPSTKPSTSTVESNPVSNTTTIMPPLSSLNLNELRKDLQMTEQRVEHLREELKEIQRKRHDFSIRAPPPPYVPPPPSIKQTVSEFVNHNRTKSPIIHEFISSSQQQNLRPIVTNTVPSSMPLSNFNPVNHLPTIPGEVSAALTYSLLLQIYSFSKKKMQFIHFFLNHLVDVSKDHRHQQFFMTMHQHREQLVIHLDSLKQALNSLERLATLEPTRTELHLANMKFDTIQQKSRQLRALKSNRSRQQSPFIECRIRQLEHDLVFMLSEHQKDVQSKLELNEQRSLLVLKIMQVSDELSSIDQQIQQ